MQPQKGSELACVFPNSPPLSGKLILYKSLFYLFLHVPLGPLYFLKSTRNSREYILSIIHRPNYFTINNFYMKMRFFDSYRQEIQINVTCLLIYTSITLNSSAVDDGWVIFSYIFPPHVHLHHSFSVNLLIFVGDEQSICLPNYPNVYLTCLAIYQGCPKNSIFYYQHTTLHRRTLKISSLILR